MIGRLGAPAAAPGDQLAGLEAQQVGEQRGAQEEDERPGQRAQEEVGDLFGVAAEADPDVTPEEVADIGDVLLPEWLVEPEAL